MFEKILIEKSTFWLGFSHAFPFNYNLMDPNEKDN